MMHLPIHGTVRFSASSCHGVHRHRGLSTLELIGCLIAVGTGIWLGALYIGFDLREVWNFGAEKAGFTSLEMAVPEDHEDAEDKELVTDSMLSGGKTESEGTGQPSAKEGIAAPAGSAVSNQPSRAGSEKPPMDATGTDEGNSHAGALGKGASDGIEGQPSNPGTDAPDSEEAATTLAKNHADEHRKESTGQESLVYWNQMNDIMIQEEKMRAVPSHGLTAANAMTFLANREKAARYAAKAIRRLPTQDVDPALCRHAQAIAEWYLQGAALSERAFQLLTSGSPSLRKGPIGKKWKADEQQHLDELHLINHRSKILQSQLSHQYGIPFPDLR